jgi:N utilization substance protein A
MAVWSNDPNVDPIGACVGVGGKRVNAVVDELHGEKIDIINWSDSSAELIENALSPAQVICVLADDDEKTAIVVVPDNMLSLAIGKVGQNARLAAKLTGYKIDIKNETQARESGLFEEIGYIDDYFDSETDDGSGEFEIGGDYAEEYDEFTGEVIGYADETPDEGTAGHEAANDGEDMGHEDTDHEDTDQENTEQEDTGLEEDGHDHMEAEALDNPGEDREE